MNRLVRILLAQERPIRFLTSRILWKTGLSKRFLIRQKDYSLRFYPSSLSASLWVNSQDRQNDDLFLRRYLRPGDVVIDVGANIGSTVLPASMTVGVYGKVIAIEAHPVTFGYLLGNIRLNRVQNVIPHNVALGEKQGSIFFSDKRSDDQNGVVVDRSGIEVPILPLDTLMTGDTDIALLKVDVEGYELPVLTGARNTLKKTACIYFESWDEHFAKYHYTCAELLALISDEGFQLFKPLRENRLQAIPSSYISSHCENLLALRNPVNFIERTGAELLC